jgi:hypothetical protein
MIADSEAALRRGEAKTIQIGHKDAVLSNGRERDMLGCKSTRLPCER